MVNPLLYAVSTAWFGATVLGCLITTTLPCNILTHNYWFIAVFTSVLGIVIYELSWITSGIDSDWELIWKTVIPVATWFFLVGKVVFATRVYQACEAVNLTTLDAGGFLVVAVYTWYVLE